jgi:hypothetical protein
MLTIIGLESNLSMVTNNIILLGNNIVSYKAQTIFAKI